MDPLANELLTAYRVASQEVARDRRALITEALCQVLGSQVAVAAALGVGEAAISGLRKRAAQVHANVDRVQDVHALGGPIPAISTDRRAS